MTTLTPSLTTPAAQPDARPPFARLRWMFLFTVIGSFTAAAWDGWWHTQYTFEGFFSPPHVFGYGVATILAWAIASLILNPRLRRWFGPAVAVPRWPYPVPGALILLAGSVILLGFAGLVLDNFWHTWFGLNETGWSFPHAMIGWSLLLIVLAFTACRMQLGPLGWGWKILLGWLVVILMTGATLGPYGRNNSLAMVRAEAQIPTFQVQPEVQRVYQMYEFHNLTRSNPLTIILAPLGAAAGLAFVRRMDARVWLMLGVALLVSWSGDQRAAENLLVYDALLLETPANYTGLPLIWLAGTYVLLRGLRASERAAWGVGGVVFGLMVHWTFGTVEGMEILALFSIGTAILGAWAGNKIYDAIENPSSWPLLWRVFGPAMVLPIVTGVIDLYWRFTTPQ